MKETFTSNESLSCKCSSLFNHSVFKSDLPTKIALINKLMIPSIAELHKKTHLQRGTPASLWRKTTASLNKSLLSFLLIIHRNEDKTRRAGVQEITDNLCFCRSISF